MKKLNLSLDELDVAAFEVAPAVGRLKTANGADAFDISKITMCNQATCVVC